MTHKYTHTHTRARARTHTRMPARKNTVRSWNRKIDMPNHCSLSSVRMEEMDWWNGPPTVVVLSVLLYCCFLKGNNTHTYHVCLLSCSLFAWHLFSLRQAHTYIFFFSLRMCQKFESTFTKTRQEFNIYGASYDNTQHTQINKRAFSISFLLSGRQWLDWRNGPLPVVHFLLIVACDCRLSCFPFVRKESRWLNALHTDRGCALCEGRVDRRPFPQRRRSPARWRCPDPVLCDECDTSSHRRPWVSTPCRAPRASRTRTLSWPAQQSTSNVWKERLEKHRQIDWTLRHHRLRHQNYKKGG